MNGRSPLRPMDLWKGTIVCLTNENIGIRQHWFSASQSDGVLEWRSAVSCSCFAYFFSPFFFFRLCTFHLNRLEFFLDDIKLECVVFKIYSRWFERSHIKVVVPDFVSTGSVVRRHRAKRRSRSQASNPGWSGGRRSLGIGMETGEGADGPGGPGGPGIGLLGCASFNQDST